MERQAFGRSKRMSDFLPGDVVGPEPQFDQAVFETRAEEIFGGVVKGYTLAIARNGVIVGSASGGLAVDGDDSPRPIEMDGSTSVNVESTVKMVSAVALLSFFEKDPSATVNTWLDRKIIDYFPKLWRDKLRNSNDPQEKAVELVTFRHLLQHKTGVITNFVQGGVEPSEVEVVRAYRNGNIHMITYILPYVVDPDFGKQVDDKAASQGITPDPGSAGTFDGAFFQAELATYFGKYIQSEIFDKVSVSAAPEVDLPAGSWKERLVPSCDHKTTYAGTPYFRNQQWGTSGDIPLSGDINGDGIDHLVVWRPETGEWFARTATGVILFRRVRWGNIDVAGDGRLVPMVHDMSGDAKANLVIYRSNNGRWSVVGRRYALGYSSKNDNGPGRPAEDRPEPPGCYAQGGYWFSSVEYVSWATTFGHGNTFVSQTVRDMMFDPSTNSSRDDRLGWAIVMDTQSQGFSYVSNEYGIRFLPWHDGADHNFNSAFIRLPAGYYAFGTVNSNDRSGYQVARGLLRAWIAAMGGSVNQGG